MQHAPNRGVSRAHRGLEIFEREEHGARNRGPGSQLEVDGRNRGQGSERPDHEFPHVESGHILHHHAARLHEFAVERGELHPDHQIACSAIEPAPRAADVRSHHAARRGFGAPGPVERNHLAVGCQRCIQLGERDAGLHADGEVARLILQNLPHARGADADIRGRNRPRHEALGIGAEKLDGLLRRACGGDGIAQFFGCGWQLNARQPSTLPDSRPESASCRPERTSTTAEDWAWPHCRDPHSLSPRPRHPSTKHTVSRQAAR